eukprot:TRINITY_DN6700_c0_g2_i1.p1 TRINITY_DN6700_c0_g2~~TRINITY_DN6700_c0_g2_i1.p1  ORF type:complete len:619 (-),score=145.11 TRINITY_DN6700_c0_g2_i1:163-2019(-)
MVLAIGADETRRAALWRPDETPVAAVFFACGCFQRQSSEEVIDTISQKPVFEGLIQLRPSAPPLKKTPAEPRPPGLRKGPQKPREGEYASQAECPICCSELGSSLEEVGALTFKGKRVEKDLYHVGCFTLMLSHNGGFRGQRVAGHLENLRISWGTSPTTRQPVDGFTRMPPIHDRKGWVAFLDWKGNGKLDLEELATAAAVLLPLNPQALEVFMRENFRVDSDGNITVEELELHVLPYIQEHFDSIKEGKKEDQKTMSRIRSESLLRQIQSVYNDSQQPGLILSLLENLQECIQEGDALAISLLSQLITMKDAKVRQLAARLLMQIAGEGDPQAFEAISPQLQHHSGHVRQAALEILAKVAIVGDRRAFDEASFLLNDRQAQVQVAAVRCLADICVKGDANVVDLLCSRIKERDPSVRCAVLKAIDKLADSGSQSAMKAVQHALGDREASVRVAALASLPGRASNGDLAIIQLAAAKLDDASASVRRAALHAVVGLAEGGSKECTQTVLLHAKSHLSDPEPEVRSAAMHALAQAAEAGDKASIGLACSGLQDQSPSVRRQALLALERLVLASDRYTIQAVAGRLQDADLTVRRAAEHVSEQLKKRQKPAGLFGFLGR